MGRPVNADAEATRRAILAAAIRLFGRRGPEASTLREIGAEVGVSFATVHHHFGAKADLIEACLDEAYGQLAEVGQQLMMAVAAAAPGERVAAAVRAAYRAARQHPDRSRFLLRAMVFDESSAVRRRLARAQRTLVEQAAVLLGHHPSYGRQVPLVGLGILLTRFAIATPAERTLFAADGLDPEAAAEAYLVEVAMTTLQPLRGPHE